jgi:hypothetical protein
VLVASATYPPDANWPTYDGTAERSGVSVSSPAVQDRFTPANFVALSVGDLDLGSTAPALLPDGLIFQIGKQGIGYVLDGSRLGGTGGELVSSDLCEGASAATRWTAARSCSLATPACGRSRSAPRPGSTFRGR